MYQVRTCLASPSPWPSSAWPRRLPRWLVGRTTLSFPKCDAAPVFHLPSPSTCRPPWSRTGLAAALVGRVRTMYVPSAPVLLPPRERASIRGSRR